MSQVTSGFVSGLPGVTRASLQIAPGILTRVTIQHDKSFNTVGDQFWYALLAFGPDPDDGVIDTLIAGYTPYPLGLSWYGFLEIPDDLFLIIEGVGQFLSQGVATVFETRVVLTVNGQLTKYLLKVNGVT